MSITVVNSSTNFVNTAVSPLVVNAPSGCQPGDVLVAQFFCNGTGSGITLPANWTLIGSEQINGTNRVKTAWHVFVSGETSYSWPWTGARASCGIIAFRGVDNVTPIGVSNKGQGTTGTTITVTSITTSIPGSMLVFFMAAYSSPGRSVSNELLGGSTGMTEQYDINQSSAPTLMENAGAYYLQAAAGASGDATAGLSGAITAWFGTLLALTPNKPYLFDETNPQEVASWVGN